MRRLFNAAAGLIAAAAAAVAAPVPKSPPPPNPKTAASFNLATAKMSGDMIQVVETRSQMSSRVVPETQEVNGQTITVNKVVTETRAVQVTMNLNATTVKASMADGKEIPADDLAKRIGDGAAVVRCYTAFDPEWRKLFADDVIFLEPLNAGAVGGVVRPGVVRPLPAPVQPLPQLR